MQIIVTGADGFIGRNLCVRLAEAGYDDVLPITRTASQDDVTSAVSRADFVFHLAGVNRPQDPGEFATGNAGFTETLCRALGSSGRKVPVVFSSSTQAAIDNPYGQSKRAAEIVLEQYAQQMGAPVSIFRLTNVFGKWARPNYNSAVATFCHNVARGLPIIVSDPAAVLRLVYIDDVVDAFLDLLGDPSRQGGFVEVDPVYEAKLGDVANTIQAFADSRNTLVTDRVGTGLTRALYSTYVSDLPTDNFSYQVPQHTDPRGVFVEMLKTRDSGQFSYFTAHPGITRGEHYHHSKTEKFLVIRGTAHFAFRHIVTGEVHELVTTGAEARIVETVPGWTHNITNIGDEEMIVMLWANEIFDRAKPDTVAMKVAA